MFSLINFLLSLSVRSRVTFIHFEFSLVLMKQPFLFFRGVRLHDQNNKSSRTDHPDNHLQRKRLRSHQGNRHMSEENWNTWSNHPVISIRQRAHGMQCTEELINRILEVSCLLFLLFERSLNSYWRPKSLPGLVNWLGERRWRNRSPPSCLSRYFSFC